MKTVQIGVKLDGKGVEIVSGADLWGCNNTYQVLPSTIQPHSWFQIHREEDLYKETALHREWLREEHPFPVYMSKRFDEYPSSVPMPYEELFKLWAFETPASFASSFSWMVAMAMHLNYERIFCSGVEFYTPREAWLEAPNFMAWLGIAAGRGIKIDGSTRLFEPYLYGIEERRAPVWVPQDVAQDLLLDQVLEGRQLRSDWSRRKREWLGVI